MLANERVLGDQATAGQQGGSDDETVEGIARPVTVAVAEPKIDGVNAALVAESEIAPGVKDVNVADPPMTPALYAAAVSTSGCAKAAPVNADCALPNVDNAHGTTDS